MPVTSDQVDAIRRALGNQLKGLREAAGWSQQHLADRLAYSRSHIAGAEAGLRRPSAGFWEACDAQLHGHGHLVGSYRHLSVAYAELLGQQQRERTDRLRHQRGTPEIPGPVDATTATGGLLVAHHPDRGEASSPIVAEVIDWPAWFGLRLAHAVSLVHTLTGRDADALQVLLHEEMLMFDAAPDQGLPVFEASRRQALITLATLPLTLNSSSGSTGTGAAIDVFLSHCAASMTACWHLLKGNDLDTVDRLLSGYLPHLRRVARTEATYQRRAARLASQGHRISGIIALHRDHIRAREHHCHQAVTYAGLAADPPSQVSALISLASTYFYESDPAKATGAYERALVFDAAMTPLQRSRTRAELAVVHGQLGHEKETLQAVESAHRLYPRTPEQDPSYVYAEFSRASLALEEGLAYAALAWHRPHLDYQQRAASAFASIEQLSPAAVPDRIRYEVINQQASLAVAQRDLDSFESYLVRGVQGAQLLASKQRHKEVREAYASATHAWPGDTRVAAIGRDLLPALATH